MITSTMFRGVLHWNGVEILDWYLASRTSG